MRTSFRHRDFLHLQAPAEPATGAASGSAAGTASSSGSMPSASAASASSSSSRALREATRGRRGAASAAVAAEVLQHGAMREHPHECAFGHGQNLITPSHEEPILTSLHCRS